MTHPDILEVARATGLRQQLHGVSAQDARVLLEKFIAAVDEPAAEVIADGNGLRLRRRLPAGATLFMRTVGPARMCECGAVPHTHLCSWAWPNEPHDALPVAPESDDTPLETGEADAR